MCATQNLFPKTKSPAKTFLLPKTLPETGHADDLLSCSRSTWAFGYSSQMGGKTSAICTSSGLHLIRLFNNGSVCRPLKACSFWTTQLLTRRTHGASTSKLRCSVDISQKLFWVPFITLILLPPTLNLLGSKHWSLDSKTNKCLARENANSWRVCPFVVDKKNSPLSSEQNKSCQEKDVWPTIPVQFHGPNLI